MEIVKKSSNTFWTWVDTRYISRRVVLGITIWITIHSYMWAAHFASTCMDKSGMEIAAIIAAVLTPISTLQGFIFKSYVGSKGN